MEAILKFDGNSAFNEVLKNKNLTNKVMMEKKIISGIDILKDVKSIVINKIPPKTEILSDIMKIMANYNINIYMVNQINENEYLSLYLTLDKDNDFIDDALLHIKKKYKFIKINIHNDYSIVSVKGIGLSDSTKTLSRIFKVIDEEKVTFYHNSISSISISYTIDSENVSKIVTGLCREFDL